MYGKDRDGIGRPALVDNEGILLAKTTLQDAAVEGRLFMVANQTAVATSTTLNTTWTGLGVANPTGSGKLFVFHEFSWALSVVGPAAGALCLGVTTYDANFVATITVRCARYANATSVAVVDNGATVVAPIIIRPITTYGTGAITTWQGAGWQHADLNGSIVLPAGYTLLTDTTTACTAAFLFGFMWEEIDA